MGPFELEGSDGWLSGGGLLATALGFFGAWWSLSFGLEVGSNCFDGLSATATAD